jgi:hypothetical protein
MGISQIITLFTEIIPGIIEQIKAFIAPMGTLEFWIPILVGIGAALAQFALVTIPNFITMITNAIHNFFTVTIPQEVEKCKQIFWETLETIK